MDDRTLQKQDELLEALEELDVDVTRLELTDYVRGDPTSGERNVTGAEVELTAYISFEGEDDDSPFKVK